GCTNRLWLDLHHLHERQHGGDHREEGLISLCCTHHGLVHDGLMAAWKRGDRVVFEFLDGRRSETSLGGPPVRGEPADQTAHRPERPSIGEEEAIHSSSGHARSQ
ncbi:MAG: hypothetical protein JRJ84_06530, partial [Deltaproteobacteria bacterium]|nr:hypothetical protein [Deltaproteobacteria bacterium]